MQVIYQYAVSICYIKTTGIEYRPLSILHWFFVMVNLLAWYPKNPAFDLSRHCEY